MKIIPLAWCYLTFLACPTFAETSAELFTIFRQKLEQAVTDQNTPVESRETFRRLSSMLANGERRGFSAEKLRDFGTMEKPAAVREAALALAAALDHESEARFKELDATARSAVETLIQSPDGEALKPLAEKVHTTIDEAKSLVMTERGQAALQSLNETERLIQSWQAAFSAQSDGQPAEAMRRLGNSGSELQRIFPDLGRKLEQKSRQFARTLGVLPPAEAETEMRTLLEKVLAAATPQELDPILNTLRTRRELWNAARQLGAAESADLADRCAKFAASWQEHVAAKAAGANDRARSILAELARADANLPGVPRSLLLERSYTDATAESAAGARGPAPGRFEEVLATCKTLADLEAKMPELEKTARRSGGNMFTDNVVTLEDLRAINRGYQDAKVAAQPRLVLRPQASSIPPMMQPPSMQRQNFESPIIKDLRRQLTLFVLAKQFESPAVENDTPDAYLRRRLMAAREAKDWRAVQRVVDSAATAGERDQLCLPSDGTALTNYLGGVNLENAGIAPLAVASYIAALKTGSDFVPIEELRTRLAKLRTESPADYEEGLKMAASGGPDSRILDRAWRGSGTAREQSPGPPESTLPGGRPRP
jgi:hypothetical protein